ncbi:hypothetical protein CDAR_286151 [Caerostris darwini]|uniref:Uncharacterized protein n=1 Tax=Caerostris darwini TaxID=1538125 RepID=A0AAV4N3F1_9ARAC|nr:hypothetical protein CDAR_286151 [Caerostris darwini]
MAFSFAPDLNKPLVLHAPNSRTFVSVPSQQAEASQLAKSRKGRFPFVINGYLFGASALLGEMRGYGMPNLFPPTAPVSISSRLALPLMNVLDLSDTLFRSDRTCSHKVPATGNIAITCIRHCFSFRDMRA